MFGRVADRLGIHRIILLSLHVGLHIRRRDQPHIMAERRDLPGPEVRGRAGFHADQAGFEPREKVQHRPAAQSLLQDDGAADIDPVKLKDRLGQVDPECCNFHVVGSFLCWLSHCTNMAHCDAVGVEPSTPSEESLWSGPGRPPSVWR